MSDDFVLYGYFRSSAAFRVRIALNLKGITPQYRFVHLRKDGGQQHSQSYRAVNPQEIIPTLVHDSHVIGQSLAAINEKELACVAFGDVARKYPRASSGVKQAIEREQKRVRC